MRSRKQTTLSFVQHTAPISFSLTNLRKFIFTAAFQALEVQEPAASIQINVKKPHKLFWWLMFIHPQHFGFLERSIKKKTHSFKNITFIVLPVSRPESQELDFRLVRMWDWGKWPCLKEEVSEGEGEGMNRSSPIESGWVNTHQDAGGYVSNREICRETLCYPAAVQQLIPLLMLTKETPPPLMNSD